MDLILCNKDRAQEVYTQEAGREKRSKLKKKKGREREKSERATQKKRERIL